MISYLFLIIPMQKEALADELGPLLEPEPVLFSMDTLGWKVSFILIGLVTIVLSTVQIVQFRRKKYRRIAIANLTEFLQKEDIDNASIINYANLTLKKVAIEVYGREDIANLYGNSWISFLDSKSSETNFYTSNDTFLNASHGLELVSDTDCDLIIGQTKKWIMSHAR